MSPGKRPRRSIRRPRRLESESGDKEWIRNRQLRTRKPKIAGAEVKQVPVMDKLKAPSTSKKLTYNPTIEKAILKYKINTEGDPSKIKPRRYGKRAVKHMTEVYRTEWKEGLVRYLKKISSEINEREVNNWIKQRPWIMEWHGEPSRKHDKKKFLANMRKGTRSKESASAIRNTLPKRIEVELVRLAQASDQPSSPVAAGAPTLLRLLRAPTSSTVGVQTNLTSRTNILASPVIQGNQIPSTSANAIRDILENISSTRPVADADQQTDHNSLLLSRKRHLLQGADLIRRMGLDRPTVIRTAAVNSASSSLQTSKDSNNKSLPKDKTASTPIPAAVTSIPKSNSNNISLSKAGTEAEKAGRVTDLVEDCAKLRAIGNLLPQLKEVKEIVDQPTQSLINKAYKGLMRQHLRIFSNEKDFPVLANVKHEVIDIADDED